MTLYQATLDYFRELSHIPRMSLHEEKVKTWITQWAEERGWSHETDSIGNLLVIAMGSKEEKVCLQAHLDMVCVADGKHNFAMQGITLLEKEGTISGQKTTL
jgi:dipeptidase D